MNTIMYNKDLSLYGSPMELVNEMNKMVMNRLPVWFEGLATVARMFNNSDASHALCNTIQEDCAEQQLLMPKKVLVDSKPANNYQSLVEVIMFFKINKTRFVRIAITVVVNETKKRAYIKSIPEIFTTYQAYSEGDGFIVLADNYLDNIIGDEL